MGVINSACRSIEDSVAEDSKTAEKFTNREDEFLSRYKFTVHANTDPLARASVFKNISSEFKLEFDKDVSNHDLYNFYNIT